jgi:cardiolipin synthase
MWWMSPNLITNPAPAIRAPARFAQKCRNGGGRIAAVGARGRAMGERRFFMSGSWVFANLPNLITLARLLLTPMAVTMIVSQRFVAAFLIFVAAGASDAVDGFIARRFDLRSELGSYLDPLADKALVNSMYIALATIGVIWPALAILVVSRDLMILAAVLISWLLGKPVAIRPVWISKFNTLAQIAFAALALGLRAFGYDDSGLRDAVAWMVAASTLASGGVYIAQWLDHMSR